jgi:SAM-dependent methyltransferase
VKSRADLEAERIRAEFQRRDRALGDYYAVTNPSNLFIRQGQQRALLRALVAGRLLPLSEQHVLEVGCGRGDWLSMLDEFGAHRESLAGVDLDADRINVATSRVPGADLRVGDATSLPWEDKRFTIVLQSTVFTSILDPHVRDQVAREMVRVVADRGTILWYDFRYNNPRNPNVRGIERGEIERLFPGWDVELSAATLAPPLARWLVPKSWLMAAALERIAPLNTHYFGVIRRRA